MNTQEQRADLCYIRAAVPAGVLWMDYIMAINNIQLALGRRRPLAPIIIYTTLNNAVAAPFLVAAAAGKSIASQLNQEFQNSLWGTFTMISVTSC
jgi:hypothetical protein